MGQVSLDDVIITSELTHRSSRAPDYRAELRAIKMLVSAMSEAPDEFWQRLAEAALQLCRAGTAGASLLDTESGVEVFRLAAVVGVLSGSVPDTIPRDGTPCAAAIDRDGPQLLRFPERVFPSLKFEQPIAEALIIPFDVQGKPAGTLWVMGHNNECKFDREDERIGKTLAFLATAGWHIRNRPRIVQSPAENIESGHIGEELRHLSQGLEERAAEKTAELIAAASQVDTPQHLVEQRELSLVKNLVADEVEASDLNSLLTLINGYAALMKEDLNDPTRLQADAEAISEAAALVRTLINSGSMKRLGRASS